MSHVKLLTSCVFFCLTYSCIWAQSSALTNQPDVKPLLQKLKQIKVFSEDESSFSWILFEDEATNAFFVDFDHFDVNLKQIVVKNHQDQVISKKEVFDLPVDAIFEISLDDHPEGFYTIEVHSFLNVFSKSVYLEGM